jgi:hypothetical protein
MVYGSSRYWYSWTKEIADAELDHTPSLRVITERLYAPPDLLLLCYPLGLAPSPPPSDIMVRREALEIVGGFEAGFPPLYEDQAFLAKLYLNARVYVSGEEWDRYRIHPDSCSARAVKAGEDKNARRFYLEWLAGYLDAHNEHAPRVRKALRAALDADSDSRFWRFVRNAGRLRSRLTNLARLLFEGGLRGHLRRRRWLDRKRR